MPPCSPFRALSCGAVFAAFAGCAPHVASAPHEPALPLVHPPAEFNHFYGEGLLGSYQYLDDDGHEDDLEVTAQPVTPNAVAPGDPGAFPTMKRYERKHGYPGYRIHFSTSSQRDGTFEDTIVIVRSKGIEYAADYSRQPSAPVLPEAIAFVESICPP